MAYVIQLVSIILSAGYAIKDAESASWKWANLGIIIGSMVAGFVLPLLIGITLHDEESGILFGAAAILVAGFVASFGAIAGNKYRAGGIRQGHKPRYAQNNKTVI